MDKMKLQAVRFWSQQLDLAQRCGWVELTKSYGELLLTCMQEAGL